MKKSILIISRNIYRTNSPRSIRWLKFIYYLGQKYNVIILSKYRIQEKVINKFSANVINYSVKNGEFDQNDNAISSSRIYNQKVKNQLYYKIRDFMKKIYYTLSFPDKYWNWPFEVLYKVFLNNKIKNAKFDIIICPSPTPSNLLAGVLIKSFYNGKLIFDIGDPWAYCPNANVFPWRRKVDSFVENALLKQADYIIVNTKELQKLYIDKFDVEKSKIKCIYSGADKVAEVKEVGVNPKNDRFKIVYTGQFHDKVREPYSFFRAVASLNSNINLDIKIAGDIYPWFIDYYKRLNSTMPIDFLGHIEHSKAREMQQNSDLLLLFSNKSEYQLPSKVFEYLVTNKAILVITYNNIIKDIVYNNFANEEGLFFIEDNSELIKNKIVELYKFFVKKGNLNYKRRDVFSWESRYRLLENILSKF